MHIAFAASSRAFVALAMASNGETQERFWSHVCRTSFEGHSNAIPQVRVGYNAEKLQSRVHLDLSCR